MSLYVNTPDLDTARRFYLDALLRDSEQKATAAEKREDWVAMKKWDDLSAKRAARLSHFHKKRYC